MNKNLPKSIQPKRCVLMLLVPILFAFYSNAQVLDSTNLPAVWLRADKGDVRPLFWSDYSGNMRHATALQGEGPLLNQQFNYNPAFSFDGVKSYMKIPYSVEGLDELTIIAVFHSLDTTEMGVWGAENALARNIMLTTKRAAGPDSTLDNIGNNGGFAVLSTVVQNWNKVLTISDAAYLALGNAGKQKGYKPFKGALAELLVFNRRLDFLDLIKYETYLAIKYGISVPEHNYVSAHNKILWSAEGNKKYAHHITGIGKDTIFHLNQKQSISASDTKGLLILSSGVLAATNAANNTVIPEGNYLVWGDNNDSLVTNGNNNVNQLDLLNRNWMMNATGIESSRIKTSIKLDLKQLPHHQKGYWLVINRNGQEDFGIDRLSYIIPDSISHDSIAFFNNVEWDTDRSGQDVFSFAKSKGFTAILTAIDSPTCKQPMMGKTSVQFIGGKAPFQYELVNATTGNIRKGSLNESHGKLTFEGLYAGNYLLRVSDAEAHQSSREFNLTIPNPLFVDLGADKKLTNGSDIVLDAGRNIPTGMPVAYKWSGSYGLQSSGEKLRVTETGIYKVEVTNNDGCFYSDEITVYGAGKQRFEVYPSISTDGDYNVSISLSKSDNITVYLTDLKGNKLREMKGKNGSEFHFTGKINTKGMYLVVWYTDKGVETRKIIVQ